MASFRIYRVLPPSPCFKHSASANTQSTEREGGREGGREGERERGKEGRREGGKEERERGSEGEGRKKDLVNFDLPCVPLLLVH